MRAATEIVHMAVRLHVARPDARGVLAPLNHLIYTKRMRMHDREKVRWWRAGVKKRDRGERKKLLTAAVMLRHREIVGVSEEFPFYRPDDDCSIFLMAIHNTSV